MRKSLDTTPIAIERGTLRRPITDEVLREITDRIAAVRPDAVVVLFGSRARGGARPESDVDLLVVTETDESTLAVAGKLYAAIGPRDFGVDLVVMTPTQLARRRGGVDAFVREILAEGRTLRGRIL